jgi:hypothetical protein
MCKVFVIDSQKRPLDPIHSAQARQLLRNKKAAVFRQFPFTMLSTHLYCEVFLNTITLLNFSNI